MRGVYVAKESQGTQPHDVSLKRPEAEGDEPQHRATLPVGQSGEHVGGWEGSCL